MSDVIEKWGIFETEFAGPAEGNPHIEVKLSAIFRRELGRNRGSFFPSRRIGAARARMRFAMLSFEALKREFNGYIARKDK